MSGKVIKVDADAEGEGELRRTVIQSESLRYGVSLMIDVLLALPVKGAGRLGALSEYRPQQEGCSALLGQA